MFVHIVEMMDGVDWFQRDHKKSNGGILMKYALCVSSRNCTTTQRGSLIQNSKS